MINKESENEEQECNLYLDQSIEEMNRLLKFQPHSKMNKICKIIRESVELSSDDIISYISETEDKIDTCNNLAKKDEYETLKNDVLKILRREVDKTHYQI